MEWRISVNEWRLLPEKEKALFEFISNEEGCYFRRLPDKEEGNDSENVVDDFNRLTNRMEE
ncbi:hypothetical protein GVK83_13110 [Enterococcus hirae]|uniref:hypothetical protein n=1 Tax=Enterococcus TaxID=1350 RepID=UPI000DEB6B74|nr:MULTISPECIES: hypothetical protein [Enterococcus]MBL3708409.1 hypothetical protein [Enterococcus faecium]MDQ8220575.1 hypothetical protein [Enterococcus faecium]NBA28526.1 hypothetical protein [Enterococcus hirae]NBA37708.1 hypothetical protein [Enterococcus hirae]NTK43011.1 hypothetical protein [Enterococcus faecium]